MHNKIGWLHCFIDSRSHKNAKASCYQVPGKRHVPIAVSRLRAQAMVKMRQSRYKNSGSILRNARVACET